MSTSLYYRATCDAASLAELPEAERTRPSVFVQTSSIEHDLATSTALKLYQNGYRSHGQCQVVPATPAYTNGCKFYHPEAPRFVQMWILTPPATENTAPSFPPLEQ